MKKQEFLRALKKKLSGLPRRGVEERLNFYSEMIDDRMEEGLDEEEAVLAVGSIEDIVSQITSEGQLLCDSGEQARPRKKLTAWEIALLIIGSPVWLPLLICVFAVIFVAFTVIWSLIITAWALEIPFFIFSFISKYLLIFCKKATKCTALFTKSTTINIFKLFTGGKTHQ